MGLAYLHTLTPSQPPLAVLKAVRPASPKIDSSRLLTSDSLSLPRPPGLARRMRGHCLRPFRGILGRASLVRTAEWLDWQPVRSNGFAG